MSKGYVPRLQKKLEYVGQQRDGAYKERNTLVSFLTKIYPSVIKLDTEAKRSDPFRYIVYIETPEGQLSWHFGRDLLHLFSHLETITEEIWDKHTDEEKYQRLKLLGDNFKKISTHI